MITCVLEAAGSQHSPQICVRHIARCVPNAAENFMVTGDRRRRGRTRTAIYRDLFPLGPTIDGDERGKAQNNRHEYGDENLRDHGAPPGAGIVAQKSGV